VLLAKKKKKNCPDNNHTRGGKRRGTGDPEGKYQKTVELSPLNPNNPVGEGQSAQGRKNEGKERKQNPKGTAARTPSKGKKLGGRKQSTWTGKVHAGGLQKHHSIPMCPQAGGKEGVNSFEKKTGEPPSGKENSPLEESFRASRLCQRAPKKVHSREKKKEDVVGPKARVYLWFGAGGGKECKRCPGARKPDCTGRSY